MSTKLKSKVRKLMDKVDSPNDDSEHELAFYVNDRVQLMKEVLKIIKAKKIKSMAPDCIKDLDIEEINSMLLEELLGISNKRLKYIFNGQSLGEDSSSTENEEEKPIDIISLDDVSDDDFEIEGNSENSKRKGNGEPKVKKIKKEKSDKKSKQKDGRLEQENLMSVLELLELQARARAIRSQLTLEANKKVGQSTDTKSALNIDSDSDNSVIIEVPKSEEIVIDSSESESEQQTQKSNGTSENSNANQEIDLCVQDICRRKITLIRDRFDQRQVPTSSAEETCATESVEEKANETETVDADTSNKENDEPEMSKEDDNVKVVESSQNNKEDGECANDEDEIILIVDQEEIDGIIGD